MRKANGSYEKLSFASWMGVLYNKAVRKSRARSSGTGGPCKVYLKKGAVAMRKNDSLTEYTVKMEKTGALPWAGGCPQSVKRAFWPQSPWHAFRLIGRGY